MRVESLSPELTEMLQNFNVPPTIQKEESSQDSRGGESLGGATSGPDGLNVG